MTDLMDFVEVETPTLFRSTPGGASEFLVPSRFPGQFYSLPQSPQQFKQLLMVGGVDRYMQVARCYRDESSKSDRQPEFTQLDLEMSYVQQDDIMNMVELTIAHSWPHAPDQLTSPFPRITYADAMTKFGTDKPDTRFAMQLQDVTDCLLHSGVRVLDDSLDQPHSSVQALYVHQGSKYISSSRLADLLKVVKTQNASDNQHTDRWWTRKGLITNQEATDVM